MTRTWKFAATVAAAALSLPMAAHATITDFAGSFAAEAVGATGSGSLTVRFNDVLHTVTLDATWAGLSGTTSNAHIHCCTAAPTTGTAGVALATGGILPGFPLGIQAGRYVRTIDLSQASNYSAAFVTASGGTAAGAEARLIANLGSGNAYFNIHSSTFGGGEIRAFVTAVPEPATYALMLAGLAGVLTIARRKKQA